MTRGGWAGWRRDGAAAAGEEGGGGWGGRGVRGGGRGFGAPPGLVPGLWHRGGLRGRPRARLPHREGSLGGVEGERPASGGVLGGRAEEKMASGGSRGGSGRWELAGEGQAVVPARLPRGEAAVQIPSRHRSVCVCPSTSQKGLLGGFVGHIGACCLGGFTSEVPFPPAVLFC